MYVLLHVSQEAYMCYDMYAYRHTSFSFQTASRPITHQLSIGKNVALLYKVYYHWFFVIFGSLTILFKF